MFIALVEKQCAEEREVLLESFSRSQKMKTEQVLIWHMGSSGFPRVSSCVDDIFFMVPIALLLIFYALLFCFKPYFIGTTTTMH